MQDRERIHASLRAYVDVWSETDPARRVELLGVCWHDASEIVGPDYHFTGTRAVLDEIARFQRNDPGMRPVQTSGFDRHGRWVRFAIALVDADGTTINEGWDIVELEDDARIRRVVTFWGVLPPPDSEGT